MISHYGLLIILRITGYLSAAVPHGIRQKSGYILGRLLMALSSSRVALTRENIIKAFPEKDSTFHEDVLFGSYANLGTVLLEIAAMYFMSNQLIASKMSFTNITLIDNILKRGKGIVIISGHLANWEYLAFTAGIHAQRSFLLVAKEQRNAYINEAITFMRTRAGNTTVSMEKAAKPLVRALQHHQPIAMLIDQAADPKRDAIIPFLGRDAVVFEAPAALALRFQTPLVFAVPIRQKDGTYKVTLTEIPMDDLSDSPSDIVVLTKRHTAFLEEAIRTHPEQWTWQHNRWKYHA